jgi:hypothetical protein
MASAPGGRRCGHDEVLLLVKTVTEPPADEAKRWTMEALAQRLRSEAGVDRVVDVLHDPEFWAKAADACGLYLHPPRCRG